MHPWMGDAPCHPQCNPLPQDYARHVSYLLRVGEGAVGVCIGQVALRGCAVHAHQPRVAGVARRRSAAAQRPSGLLQLSKQVRAVDHLRAIRGTGARPDRSRWPLAQ